MELCIERAHPEHLPEIAELARVIWHAHYPGIISRAQIEYMLARRYDVNVLREELRSGIDWFRATESGDLLGFASGGPADASEFKLHKLYVHPEHQRRGVGTALLRAVESAAAPRGAKRLVLNVNKRNEKAIAAYRQHGFSIRDSVVVEIGSGFLMDDYVMVKPLGG